MKYLLDARTASDHFPGIGRYVSSLAASLVPLLHPEEELLLLHDPTVRSRWTLPQPGKRVAHIPTSSSPFGLSQQWVIPRIIKTLQPDVYHSPYYLMPWWTPVPTVLTVYDLIPEVLPGSVSWRARALFHQATRLALRNAAHVICISESTQKDVTRFHRYPADRMSVTPLAPGPTFQPQSNWEITRLREKYGLPIEFACYLGINKPHKNLLKLVEVWGMSKPKLPLVIAGAWDERYPDARSQAAALNLENHVRFLGPLPEEDLPGLLSACAFFIFPSEYEGFGLPVIEAMACGTPVACSNTSSLPEIVGDAALLFNPNDIHTIIDAVDRLIQDPKLRETLSQLGIERAAQFSWDRTAAATLEIYRSITYNSGR